MELGDHLDESQLENYALGRVSAREAALIEEHVLTCEACQRRLTATDQYVSAMQQAARRTRVEAANPRWSWGFPRLVAALATLVLVIAIGAFLRQNGGQKKFSPSSITLEATRGSSTAAEAPAGRPLLLKPGLVGLPASPGYHLEVVDRNGKRVWQGTIGTGGEAEAPQQPPGLYFVRLYDAPGTLLREYAMEVKAAQ
ncbi:MAG: hypothetical protein C5B51_19230 [Terriglobia bacterium]|nr:MAG: hypothetical protein C5B51_19230 [Terriglobia bacterium]